METTPALHSNTVVTRTIEVISAKLGDGESVMMSLDQGEYYSMDEIGSRIWELMEQPLSVAELCELLLEEFEVEREGCQQDVLEFLTVLHGEGLVQVVDRAEL